MIPAAYYYDIYLMVVTLLTIPVISWYKTATEESALYKRDNRIGSLLLLIAVVLFVGFRPLSGRFFGDMANYYGNYIGMRGNHFTFSMDKGDPLFTNILDWFASNSIDFSLWCTLVAFIYFGLAYIAIRRMFWEHSYAVFLCYLAAFSTFSYATNGMRAGGAASIFLLALSYREKLLVCLPLALISYGFHHSMQLPVAALILTLFFNNARWYYYGWLFCLLMALLHVGFFSSLFASFTDKTGANYLSNTDATSGNYGGAGGFRLDFVLYSAIPVIVGYITEIRNKIKVSKLYETIMHVYICTNGIWMLCMYATFTNRIAYLSWQLYPIILLYPFLNEDTGYNRFRNCSKAIGWHLVFTLFMQLIFYKLLK